MIGPARGDGDDDIVWRHQDGAVVTWEMENGGYVRNHNLAVVAASWDIEGVHDFNGDGTDDILWRHTDGNVVTWEMRADALGQVRNFGFVSNEWQIVATGEFDVL